MLGFAQGIQADTTSEELARVSEQESELQPMKSQLPRMHPANLALPFGLELTALTAIGAWGLDQTDGPVRYGLMLGLPATAGAAWRIFNIPDAPSRGVKGLVRVPGFARLGVEFAVLGFASWAMWDMGHTDLAKGYVATTAVRYAIFFRHIQWLLKQRA